MKIKIKKQDDGVWIFLPKERFSSFLKNQQTDQLEGLMLSEDMLLLLNEKANSVFVESNKGIDQNNEKKEIKKQIPIQKTLKEDQMDVLQKLSKIPFSTRTYDYIQKHFSQKEKEILDSLIKIKIVDLYKGQKYPNGVYTINEKFYQKQNFSNKDSEMTKLENFGYMFFTDFENAKRFHEANNKRLRLLEARLKKGFDKKIYCVLPSFIEENKIRILDLIEKEPKTVQYLEEKTKIPKEGIYALLLFLAEDGLVFEKTKGSWQKV